MKKFLMIFATILGFATIAFAYPTLIFKNQFGEQTNGTVLGGTLVGLSGTQIAANSIVANLTGSTALPVASSYSAVGAKLPANMVLTGFSAGAGTCAATDTVQQCLQKLAGNVAAHQANSTATDVAGLVSDFNALLAKLQAAHLMQ